MTTRATFTACALMVLSALPVTLAARPGAPNGEILSLTPSAPATDVQAPAFRLGTAARPFGWSTAIGDLNADGRPDVVVADRASWNVAGYRLDISLAGEPTSTETFQSAEEAVGIRVVDVDHDADLDIVLASVTSGRTVGVWLNDGAGHFTRSASRMPVPASVTGTALDQAPASTSFDAAEVPSRRLSGATAARARAPTPGAVTAPLPPSQARAVFTRALSPASPRAPPASLTPVRL